MAVTVDATATSAVTTAGATTLTNSNLTVGAGATALLAWLSHDQIAIPVDTISAINWDDSGTPQAMTQLLDISSPNTNLRVRLFGLVNPTSGNKALKVTWVNSDPAVLDCISFNGTINSTVAAAFLHAATNSALTGSPSLSITSAVGNIVVGSVAEANAVTSLTATGSTSVFNFTSATPYGFVGAYAPGAATVAWTGAPSSVEWCIGGVDVVAAPVAGVMAWPRAAVSFFR